MICVDGEVRNKIGQKAVTVSVTGKIILTILNFIIGTLSGSTALVAESAHTFSDIFTSAIAFIGFKIGLKPADKDHPYGHGKAEPLAGLLIVIFLVLIAYEIFLEVFQKLALGTSLTPPGIIAAIMALIGIVANFLLSSYSMRIGKKINSSAIMADAKHQKVDIYACVAIFLGILGSRMGIPILDPLVGGFVGLLILKTAFDVALENIDHIMGKIPSDKIINEVKSAALTVDGIYGVHDIKINDMGPYATAELHVEVEGDMIIREAHKLAHITEDVIIDKIEIINSVIVHVCPLDEDENCID
jgi:cation diffusion facilitator family transporter